MNCVIEAFQSISAASKEMADTWRSLHKACAGFVGALTATQKACTEFTQGACAMIENADDLAEAFKAMNRITI